MIYEKRLNDLAEKMAEKLLENDSRYQWRFLSIASKKKRTKQMLPLAAIALDQMAIQRWEGYKEGWEDYKQKDCQAAEKKQFLQSLGLTPTK